MKRTNQFERTDRDITNALLALMDKKTFEKITVQDILEEAMVNRSTFYQHYKDKYEILERLQTKLVGEMTEHFNAAKRSGSPTLEDVNAIMLAFFRVRHPELKKICSVRSKNLDMERHLKELFRQYILSSSSVLGDLERDMMAEITVKYLLFRINDGSDIADLSTAMLSSWLDMTVFFMRLEDIPNAKERLLRLVVELHGDE